MKTGRSSVGTQEVESGDDILLMGHFMAPSFLPVIPVLREKKDEQKRVECT